MLFVSTGISSSPEVSVSLLPVTGGCILFPFGTYIAALRTCWYRNCSCCANMKRNTGFMPKANCVCTCDEEVFREWDYLTGEQCNSK